MRTREPVRIGREAEICPTCEEPDDDDTQTVYELEVFAAEPCVLCGLNLRLRIKRVTIH
ncbi:MAG: hypothetical protein ABIR94_21795 [Rubrivivax sp.]